MRGARGLGDPPHARARQVEARRARAPAERRARSRSSPRAARSRSGPTGPSSCAWRTRSRTRSRSSLETPGGRDRADRRLQDRPHAGGRLPHRPRQARRPRQPRRRPPARRLDERRAAGRDAVGADRRRGLPPDHPAARGPRPRSPPSPRTSTACSRRSTSRVEAGRKVCLVGRSLRKNVNIARNLGYIDVPRRAAREAGRARASSARTRR